MQSKHLPFLLPIFLTVVASLLFGVAECSGERTWGEACNPSASLHDDQSTFCDTSKRLSCDMKTRTCICHHEARDIYNKAADRCETKLGAFCSGSETLPTICVENAECDAVTNFCKCKQGSTKTEDGTGCIKEDDDDENGASSPSHFIYVSIAILTIGAQVWF